MQLYSELAISVAIDFSKPFGDVSFIVMKQSGMTPLYDKLKSRLIEDDEAWLLELARWYEADWAGAVEGRTPPSADTVLSALDERQRLAARPILQSIHDAYSNGLGNANEPESVVGDHHRTPVLSANDGQPSDESRLGMLHATLDGSSPTEADDADKTVDFDPNATTGNGGLTGATNVTWGKQASNIGPTATTLPGYELKEVLGRGGMGVVYLAKQKGIDRNVALKMIVGGLHTSEEARKRFEFETRAIGKFQHENIVRIYDSGTHQAVPYFALEFIDGSDLSKRIGGEPMPANEAAETARLIANAMQYSHQHGVIHRDLKPSNILLTAEGVPKVSDFGLAKEIEEDAGLSRTGTVIGTPAFMAPEQAAGASDIGTLADVYGVGAILYCMLTGRPPFQSTNATDTLVQVVNNEPIPPVALQPSVPSDLQTICLKAMQKDRERRYQSAGELADDLGRFKRGEPIHARPTSRLHRVVRWCRRHPKIALPAGIAAALALTVLIGGPITAAIIHAQKEEVVAEKLRADQNAHTSLRNEQAARSAQKSADANAEAAQVQEKLAIDALKSVTFNVNKRMLGDP